MARPKKDYQYILKWAKKFKAAELLGGKCNRCGESSIFCLEFHHPDDNKEFELSDLKDYAWSVWEKEIAKCELICANCHAEHHFQHNAIKTKILGMMDTTTCPCGYACTGVEFHHDKGQKNFSIGDVVGRKVYPTDDELRAELALCSIICRNCHRREHIDKDRFAQLESAIHEKIKTMKSRTTDAEKERIRELLTQGWGIKTIHKEFGWPLHAIRKINRSLSCPA